MSILRVAETIGVWKGSADFLAKTGLLVLAFFSPLKGVILTLILLICLDLITGLIAALKNKTKVTSAKLSRTVTKTLVYLFTIMLVQICAEYVILIDNIPITNMVASFIILTELQSVLENLNKLSKQSFLTVLIDKISLITKGREILSKDRIKKRK